uniref:Interleukin 34 n=1 Tax=Ornithorhynchus anatinus TaxID=9258 RepID=A0A6I8PC32_ORNAN
MVSLEKRSRRTWIPTAGLSVTNVFLLTAVQLSPEVLGLAGAGPGRAAPLPEDLWCSPCVLSLGFQKRYFPIDYRIGVPYGMVLRLANVTRLQKAEVAVSTQRLLWASVSLDALSAIQEVLMEEHPSWNYISEIILLLSTVKQNVVRNPMDTATHSLASSRVPDSGRKPVRPKALLDNCFRVMELLYWSCCKQNSTRDWDVCGRRAPETGPIAV